MLIKIKRFGLRRLLIAGTWAATGLLFSLPVGGQTMLLGNCGDQKCEEILAKLRNRWSEQIRQYEAECNGNKILGLQVFFNQGEGNRVVFVCWGEKEPDGSRYGNWLGVLPFPGEEATFASSWICPNRKCKEILAKLRNSYPEQLRQYEVLCAMKSGDLLLNVSKVGVKHVEVECGFFVYTLFSARGDGVADGDRGTAVGIILGTLPLPK